MVHWEPKSSQTQPAIPGPFVLLASKWYEVGPRVHGTPIDPVQRKGVRASSCVCRVTLVLSEPI